MYPEDYQGDAPANRIDTYKMFYGILIPIGIVNLPVSQLSQGAKLLYGRLCLYAGKDGKTYPSRELLAFEVGCSTRQVDNYVTELKEFGLIDVKRNGCGKNNNYYFLHHDCLNESYRLPNAFDKEWKYEDSLDVQQVADILYKIKSNKNPTKQILLPDYAGETIEEIENFTKDIFNVVDFFKEKINPNVKFTRPDLLALLERLQEYTLDELKEAIEGFTYEQWYMRHHRYGHDISWYFNDDDRVAVFIANLPEKKIEGVFTKP